MIRTGAKAWTAIQFAILGVLSLLTVYPLVFAIISSLRTGADYVANPIGLPRVWTTEAYGSAVAHLDIPRNALNSMILVPLALVLYLGVVALAAYAFAFLHFRGRRPAFTLLVTIMVFPQMLITIQAFRIVATLGLINTFAGIIIVWVAYFSPFGTFLLTGYFRSIPKSLVDSTHMDGAGPVRALVSVILPVATPMVAIVLLVGFLAMWNEIPFSVLVLQRPEMRTLVLSVAMLQGEFGMSVPELSAVAIIAAFLPLMLFLVLQRRIVGGAFAGSIK